MSSQPFTACFSVHAPTDPSVMPRVIEVFARRGMGPSSLHSTVCGPSREQIQIDLQITDITNQQADMLAAALRQLVCVDCVLTSRKLYALSA